MSTVTPPARASDRLAFWAKNMTVIRAGRMAWPGFSYTDAEWARMDVLSGAVSDRAYAAYKLVNAAIFIVVAAIGIAAVFLPLATLLFPVPAETGALKFTLLLAACCFLIIGLGLPVSLAAAARLCSDRAALAVLPVSPLDGPLASKISWQINRIMLIMCGLLVPGVLIFIAYDIKGGPVITALKWSATALVGVSTAVGVAQRRKAKS